jgi:hypothetical protein
MGAANVNGQINRPSMSSTDNGDYGSGTVKIGAA